MANVTMTFHAKGPIFDGSALRNLTNELDLFGRATVRRMASYPAQQRGKRHVFRSDRERRGFFYHLRKGDIKVPYRRTMTLARAWSNETRADGRRLLGVVGLNSGMAPYGRMVEGLEDEQTRDMVERGWPSVETVAREEWQRAIPRFEKALAG